MAAVLYTHPLLGRIYRPALWDRSMVLQDGRIARPRSGEYGLVVATSMKAICDEHGRVVDRVLQFVDFGHNERVDAGANRQALQVFGGGGSPGAVNANQFKVIAVANATLVKVKGNQSLGSTSAGVTTNEFTTLGLSRVAATIIGGDYTVPATNGAQFAQVVSHTFTATGAATAEGAGLFDSATVAGSVLYAEDNFSSAATLANNDTLRVDWTINN